MEIKRRHAAAIALFTNDTQTLYEATTIESACLQFRKILELIAFSSLIANQKSYSKQHAKFATHWNANTLLRDLERVNPKFYPQPVIQIPSPHPMIPRKIENKLDGYLTKTQFVKVYEKCGGIMHANNPYGTKTNFEYYIENMPKWAKLIEGLLNAHVVKLLGDDKRFYLFQMNKDDEMPSYNAFEQI